ncbi:MAG: hypothetical protein GXP55_07700 [Deltaproteobacteria bacterium]|nr:hypothetical protein [Deltaproteobacteria bacterium]
MDGSVGLDATSPGDAAVFDAATSDASVSDAASDAGAASACGGRCDPVAGVCPVGVCLLASSGPRCAATAGRVLAGDRCAALSDCATGLSCFLTREGGVCAPVCCPAEGVDGGSCATDERCGGTGVLVDGRMSDFRRCVGPRPCDVLDASVACDRDEGCYIVDAAGTTDCRVAGTAAAGESCVEQNDCAPGFACSGLVSPSCVRICSLRAPRAACPSGEGDCVAHAQSPSGTGLCTVPASGRTP